MVMLMHAPPSLALPCPVCLTCPCLLLLFMQWVDNHMSANLDVRKGNVKFEWFKGAKTNISYNCLDRWVVAGRGDVPCFLWEGNESNQTRVMTYEQVMSETCRVVSLGAEQGQSAHWRRLLLLLYRYSLFFTFATSSPD